MSEERRKTGLSWVMGFALAATTASACPEPSQGKQCKGTEDVSGAGGATIVYPALECASRMCYVPQGETAGSCTAKCQEDGDCGAMAKEVPCATQFLCWAVLVGQFSCQNICVCQDELLTQDVSCPVDATVDSESETSDETSSASSGGPSE